MGQIITKTLDFLRSHLDLCAGVAFIILGIAIYLLSFTQAPGISDWSLSPAFFPRLAATLIVGLSILLIVVTVSLERKKVSSPVGQIRWRVVFFVVGTIAIMVLYISLIEWLGFILSTIATMAGMMVLYGSRRWILIALISICLPLFIYFLALKVMFVLFPTGSIFQ